MTIASKELESTAQSGRSDSAMQPRASVRLAKKKEDKEFAEATDAAHILVELCRRDANLKPVTYSNKALTPSSSLSHIEPQLRGAVEDQEEDSDCLSDTTELNLGWSDQFIPSSPHKRVAKSSHAKDDGVHVLFALGNEAQNRLQPLASRVL